MSPRLANKIRVTYFPSQRPRTFLLVPSTLKTAAGIGWDTEHECMSICIKWRFACRRPSPDLCQSYGHVTWCRLLSRQPNSWRSFEVSCLIDRETEKIHDAWVNKLNLVGKSPVITWSFSRWGVRYQNPTCFSRSAISVKSAPINISLISFRHPRNRLSWEWGKNEDAPSGHRASCSNDSAILLARVVWRTRKNTGQTEYTRIYDRVGAATTGCGVVCCTCTRGRAVKK